MWPAAGTPAIPVLLCALLVTTTVPMMTVTAAAAVTPAGRRSALQLASTAQQPAKVKRNAGFRAETVSFYSDLGHLLAILPDGTVNGTTDHTSPYTVMHMINRRKSRQNKTGVGARLLRGAASGRYLCFNRRRQLFSSDFYRRRRCTFFVQKFSKRVIVYMFRAQSPNRKQEKNERRLYLSISADGQITLEPLKHTQLSSNCQLPQPKSAGKRPPSAGKRPPSAGKRPPSGGKRRRGPGRRRLPGGRSGSRRPEGNKEANGGRQRRSKRRLTPRGGKSGRRRRLKGRGTSGRQRRRKGGRGQRRKWSPRRRHQRGRQRTAQCQRVVLHMRNMNKKKNPELLQLTKRLNRRRLREEVARCRRLPVRDRPETCASLRVRRSTLAAPSVTTRSYSSQLEEEATPRPPARHARRDIAVTSPAAWQNSTDASGVVVTDEPRRVGYFQYLPAGVIPPMNRWPQIAKLDLFSCSDYKTNSTQRGNCRKQIRKHMRVQQLRADLRFEGL